MARLPPPHCGARATLLHVGLDLGKPTGKHYLEPSAINKVGDEAGESALCVHTLDRWGKEGLLPTGRSEWLWEWPATFCGSLFQFLC